jgi:hypothetical protein
MMQCFLSKYYYFSTSLNSLIFVGLFSVLLMQFCWCVDGCEFITTMSYFTHLPYSYIRQHMAILRYTLSCTLFYNIDSHLKEAPIETN